jgi:hypothetical protein
LKPILPALASMLRPGGPRKGGAVPRARATAW